MKLCEMNTSQLLDALCSLTPPLCRIAEDPHTAEAISALCAAELDSLAPVRASGIILRQLTPLLLRRHREDVLQVLSILTGKAAETLLAQNGPDTAGEAAACVDETLLRFFAFAAGTGQPAC